MTNQEFGTMLRGLASLYETHDKLPQFGQWNNRIYVYVPDKETMAMAIRVLGPGKKESVNESLNYQPERYPLSLWANKSNMGCQVIEEIVEVPRKVIPAQPERIIEAHTEKRISYNCTPFLDTAPKAVDTTLKLLEPSSSANFGGPGE